MGTLCSAVPGFVAQVHAEILPDIEAHQFKIVPLEKSRTGRIYRFKTDADQLPKVGSILLIEENKKPLLAFRVLKTDAAATQFVARRVRRYDATSELKLSERYEATEKLSDLVAPPEGEYAKTNSNPTVVPPPLTPPPSVPPPAQGSQPETAAPPVAMEQPPEITATPIPSDAGIPPLPAEPAVAAEVSPTPPPITDLPNAEAQTPAPEANPNLNVNQYDQDLDSGTSPGADEDERVSDQELGLEVKEPTVLNPYKNAVGLSVGSFRNISNFTNANSMVGGFTAYYSPLLRNSVFYKKDIPEDDLALEFGVGYYSQSNLNHNDTYNIVPLRAELRYDLYLSQTFTLLGYIGAQYNWVVAMDNVNINNNVLDAQNYDNLHGPQLNVGIGLFYNIGPQWYLRGDLGLDRFAIGLALKW
jgi:hypothetical protein